MRPPGLGEFPVTSLSETELFEPSPGELNVADLMKLFPHYKFAVPQAGISVLGQNLYLRNIQTFSGVNLDLSGTEPKGRAQCDIFIQIMTTLIIRSLDFLLLFGQAKSRRKIKIGRILFTLSILLHLTLRPMGTLNIINLYNTTPI
jgi:hypothetical protein